MKEIKISSTGELCDYFLSINTCSEDCHICSLNSMKKNGIIFEGVIKEPEEIEVTQYYKLLPNGKMITWITEAGMAEECVPSSLAESWDALGNNYYTTAVYKNKRQYKVNEKDVKLNVAWEMK